MRKMLVILVATVVTALNVNSYGKLDDSKLVEAKLMAQTQTEITIEESINWSLGFTLFKLVHFAELMFLSEFGRRRLIN